MNLTADSSTTVKVDSPLMPSSAADVDGHTKSTKAQRRSNRQHLQPNGSFEEDSGKMPSTAKQRQRKRNSNQFPHQQRDNKAARKTTSEDDDDKRTNLGFSPHQCTQRHQMMVQLRTLKQLPRAPNNTTSFLMSDREKRQHYEGINEQVRTGDVQKIAVEEQQDDDFEECLFTTSIERIERLSREEVNKELLFVDRENRALTQRVTRLAERQRQLLEENQKLRNLLEANGINN